MPVSHQKIILLLRAECLIGAALKAQEGGDIVTATRMIAEAKAATREAIELEQKARNQ